MGFSTSGDDTHHIPIDFEEANDDYMSIWLQMQNFVNKHESKQEYPPIYCLVRKYASQRPEHVLYSCN